ncbi:DUF4157 domain-containing protein [Algoriphagus sp.]|uniref:eCIS core domain-containing protein n=1 Tax=Algoriphagus sp. TaxID=1872435 RepID=UPI002612E4E8|nr:DUF4157 domain-containing protein [Algoriphagus sp.]
MTSGFSKSFLSESRKVEPQSGKSSQENKKQSLVFEDNRAETAVQKQFGFLAQSFSSGQSLGSIQPKKKENKTGLPDDLKAGIEHLSGYGLNEVKVHYNSTKPAQLQAHAFAQGNQIHLAPGQEKHLPHEAWHVVQQRQGKVKPTGQIVQNANHSLSLNSDLQLKPDHFEKQNFTDDPVQRMVTQILPGPSDTIGRINIVGRPEKLFGSSMGDHTTAFASHVEAVKLKMENKSLWSGFNGLWGLFQSTKSLPGYKLKGNLALTPSDSIFSLQTQGDRLTKAEKELNDLFSEIPDNEESFSKLNQTALALKLQECVNAYLEFRELIPLSAVNVMEVAPGLAGKGKGESKHAAVLATNEKKDTASAEELQKAILGLMDVDAAAIVVAETDPAVLQRIAPGIAPETKPIDRIGLYIEQHLGSIRTGFPNSYAKSTISREYLGNLIRNRAKEEMKKIRLILLKQYTQRKEEFTRLRANKRSGERFLKSDEKNYYKVKKEVKDYVARLRQIDELLEEKLELPDSMEEVSEEPNGYQEQAKAKEREEELVNEELKKSPIATQIKVMEKDSTFIIRSLEIAGRPISPILNSMGAHSSAWILHVERVKKALMQKSLIEAWGIIGAELLPEAKNMERNLNKANPPKTEGQDDLKEEALRVVENQSQKNIGDFSSPADLAFQLQQFINDFLSYVNFIPGVTRDAVDTTGHGEGTYIKVLREFEEYATRKEKERKEESRRNRGGSSLKSKRKKKKKSYLTDPYESRRDEKFEAIQEENKTNEVGIAIEGLLDLKGLKNKNIYREVHKELVEKTFPQTFKFLWRKGVW